MLCPGSISVLGACSSTGRWRNIRPKRPPVVADEGVVASPRGVAPGAAGPSVWSAATAAMSRQPPSDRVRRLAGGGPARRRRQLRGSSADATSHRVAGRCVVRRRLRRRTCVNAGARPSRAVGSSAPGPGALSCVPQSPPTTTGQPYAHRKAPCLIAGDLIENVSVISAQPKHTTYRPRVVGVQMTRDRRRASAQEENVRRRHSLHTTVHVQVPLRECAVGP
jgi:hypothetical protein